MNVSLNLYSTNPGAWVLGIVFVCANFLGFELQASRVRVFGTILAAVGCSIAAWFFLFIINTGILENPNPIKHH